VDHTEYLNLDIDFEVSLMVKEAGFSINQCKKDSNRKRSLFWLVASKKA